MRAPEISGSTKEERARYIRKKYVCISNCDMCGLCKVFRGKSPETAYADYIDGKRDYTHVTADYR